MKKSFITLVFFFISIVLVFAQSGPPTKAENINADPVPNYERGLPPNLFVELGFEDANSNGILEAGETGQIRLNITNKGKGKAQGLIVFVKERIKMDLPGNGERKQQKVSFFVKQQAQDQALKIQDRKKINFLQPGESKELFINLKADLDISTREYKLEINVKEHFGYDMDPAYLVLNTLAYQGAELVFSGMELIDNTSETAAIKADGQLQAGELVKAKIYVQNIGGGIAKDIRYNVHSKTSHVYIDNGEGALGDLETGAVGELWITLSPNKRVNRHKRLPVFLTLKEKNHRGDLINYPLPINLNQAVPDSKKLEVKADIEDLKQKFARFEYKSKKFTANVGEVENIEQVEPSKTKRPNSVAVVFGVEHYDNLPSAPYAERDANIVKQYFKYRLGVDQVVVYDSDETRGFVFDDVFNPQYGELQKAILKGKTELFVFYSGHGIPDKRGKEIYLFPSDGKVERLSRQGYNLSKFYTNLDKLGAKSVTVFLDACFSGASRATEKGGPENLVAMKGVKIRPRYSQPWLKNDEFSVFTSSTNEETSLAFDDTRTGLFTYYLCLGMQGKADSNKDRKVTQGELADYIHRTVTQTSRKIRGLQTPQFFGNKEKVLFKY
ncbi:putative carboxyl-terminal-processing protease, deltaproteobacterial [Salinivirga cyanobacteriivorans]|uniref:Putative carboxyl-terminal-processing protease, deltaproteobacterial n=1 Tax=Salinivirga cyanobacteriivorans TaxID=1307839 RepID=A0A0S2HWV2_9BACT|nr:caspase family protein [Salinivirga cyanobacteriivorans]ALO14504.1 putative carboxyl-terminal-processing protease, deltaproteobacterial [Salinivirga cyanobacteriivorans]